MSTVPIVRTDPNLPVDDEWAKTVCKISQGHTCCRYLARGRNGWSCEKSNPDTAMYLDGRVAAKTMNSRGDNCTGRLSR